MDLDAPLITGGQYFSRLRVYDASTPRNMNEAEGRGFYVDGTPPTAGNVTLNAIFPDDFKGISNAVTGLTIRLLLSRGSGLVDLALCGPSPGGVLVAWRGCPVEDRRQLKQASIFTEILLKFYQNFKKIHNFFQLSDNFD